MSSPAVNRVDEQWQIYRHCGWFTVTQRVGRSPAGLDGRARLVVFYRRSLVFATGLFEPAMAAAPDHGTDHRDPLLTKHLVEGRSCGPCVGCCSIYQIRALQKPKYTLCKHCTGTSCAIYNDRPDDCRKFFCSARI